MQYVCPEYKGTQICIVQSCFKGGLYVVYREPVMEKVHKTRKGVVKCMQRYKSGYALASIGYGLHTSGEMGQNACACGNVCAQNHAMQLYTTTGPFMQQCKCVHNCTRVCE